MTAADNDFREGRDGKASPDTELERVPLELEGGHSIVDRSMREVGAQLAPATRRDPAADCWTRLSDTPTVRGVVAVADLAAATQKLRRVIDHRMTVAEALARAGAPTLLGWRAALRLVAEGAIVIDHGRSSGSELWAAPVCHARADAPSPRASQVGAREQAVPKSSGGQRSEEPEPW